MADMDDDGKFREIDDESFDDSGNMYFHFHDPSDTGGVHGSDLGQGMDGLLGDLMDMSLGFVEHVFSLFPADVQESGELAMRAVSAAAAGDAGVRPLVPRRPGNGRRAGREAEGRRRVAAV